MHRIEPLDYGTKDEENMKRAIIIGMLITLLIGSVAASGIFSVQAQAGDPLLLVDSPTPTRTSTPIPASYERPILSLVSNSYPASKACVGCGFTLTVKLKNSGQKTARNMVVTFTSTWLQPLDNGGVTIVESLDPGNDVTFTQDFFIRSDINVYQTSVDISVEYKDDKATAYTQKFVAPISVYWAYSNTPTPTKTPIGKPQIVVGSYTIDKQFLVPGAAFTLTLNLKNFGAYEAKNVTLMMGVSGSTTATQFLPVGSSNIKALGNIASGQDVQLQQSFVVNSTTAVGAYPLSLKFDYKDPNGVSITDEQIITLLVYLVPSIDVSFYETPSTYTVGTKGNLPIQIVNMATASVLLGDITVSMDNATLANYQMFVGTVDGGSNFTIDTEMTPKAAGQQTIKVTITYQDNFKNLQTISRTLSINVAQQGAGAQATPAGGISLTPSAGQGTTGRGVTTAQSGTETVWDIILRAIRGLIGFDSAPVVTSPVINISNFRNPSANSTATPGR